MEDRHIDETDLVQLARLALIGKPKDVQLYVRRLINRYRITVPGLAEQLGTVLRDASKSSSPLRGAVVDGDGKANLPDGGGAFQHAHTQLRRFGAKVSRRLDEKGTRTRTTAPRKALVRLGDDDALAVKDKIEALAERHVNVERRHATPYGPRVGLFGHPVNGLPLRVGVVQKKLNEKLRAAPGAHWRECADVHFRSSRRLRRDGGRRREMQSREMQALGEPAGERANFLVKRVGDSGCRQQRPDNEQRRRRTAMAAGSGARR